MSQSLQKIPADAHARTAEEYPASNNAVHDLIAHVARGTIPADF
jgi:hypothetical protein